LRDVALDPVIKGAHLPNYPRIGTPDEDLYHRGRFDGAVAMWYHDPAVLILMGVDPDKSVVRLPDWEYVNPSSGRKELYGWREYVDRNVEAMERFYPYGFRRFQLDNEPDLYFPHHGLGPWDWATVMSVATADIALRKPPGSRLGFTPFSHPTLESKREWWRAAEDKRLLECCSWAASHCYWQASGDMYSEWAGASHLWVYNRTRLPIFITEAGNSLRDKTPRPPQEEIERRQALDYPTYIEYLQFSAPHVEAVYFFILNSQGWDGFHLTPFLCDVLGGEPWNDIGAPFPNMRREV
jgi:hypothetical protein